MSWVYFNIFFNQIPILLLTFGLMILLFNLYWQSRSVHTFCLVVFVTAALLAIPVSLSGHDTNVVLENITTASTPIGQHHSEGASRTLLWIETTGAFAFLALILHLRADHDPLDESGPLWV